MRQHTYAVLKSSTFGTVIDLVEGAWDLYVTEDLEEAQRLAGKFGVVRELCRSNRDDIAATHRESALYAYRLRYNELREVIGCAKEEDPE